MSTLPHERRTFIRDVQELLLRGNRRAVFDGQPGVGKTTALDALVQSLLARGDTRVLHSRSLRDGTRSAYHGLRDLFIDIDVDAFSLPAPRRDALLAALGRAPGGEHEQNLVHTAVDEVLRELGRGRSLVVAIDDLDRIDDETHNVIKFVARRPQGGQIRESYVATLTSDPALMGGPSTFDLAACNVDDLFHLPPLSRAAFGVALAESVRTPLTETDLDDLYRQTGGNPQWAFELVYQSPPGLPFNPVPQSLVGVTGTRIAGLAAPTVDVLAVLSVVQSRTWEEVQLIVGTGAQGIREALAAGLIEDNAGHLSATHRMLAAAAVDHLGTERSRELHATIAALSSDVRQRAHHLDKSHPSGTNEDLAELLFTAAVTARRDDDISAALHFLRRSVRRTVLRSGSLPERELALAEVLLERGALDECTEIFERLPYKQLTIAAFDRALPGALMAIAARDGELAAASFLSRLHDAADDDPIRHAVLMSYDAEAASDPSQRRALASSALAWLRESDAAPITRHRAIGSLITADVDAGLGLNLSLLGEAEQVEKLINGVALNDSADGMRALFAYQTGDLEMSRRALEAVRKRATALGQPLMVGVFGVHLAAVHVYSGRAAPARALLQEWQASQSFTSPPPSVVAAKGLLLLREVDETPLRELVAEPHTHGSETAAAIARAALSGIAAARRQRWQEAVHELERARNVSLALGIAEPGRRMWVDFTLARTYVALGRVEEAGEIRDALRDLSGGRRALLDGVAARIDGLLVAADGRTGQASDLLRASVGLLMSAGFPTETALSLMELASHLHNARERSESTETFVRASEIARIAGDAQLVGLIDDIASRTGSGSLRSLLSDRERAVAEDAAEGRTNREIADAHFLSVRTVETQLSSAYRKLGVRSRSELTALLAKDRAR